MRSSIRARVGLFLSLLPGLLLLEPAGELRGEPLRGAGDFDFYLDVSSIPVPGHGVIQLIQIAIPTKELRYVKKDDGAYFSEVRYSLLLTAGKTTVTRKNFQMRDTRNEMPRGNDLSSFVFAVDSSLVDPGEYRLTVKVEDLQHRKKTLLGVLHRSYYSSTVEDAVVEIREFPDNALVLADPILVWSFKPDGRFVPNPMQIYGLRRDTLAVIVNATLPAGSTADSLLMRLSLAKATGEIMGEETFNVPVRGARSAFMKSIDLAAYPAGGYRLTVEADAGAGMRASAGKDFNVAWELLNWQRPVRDILIEARIILHDDEYEAFEAMSVGERESFMKGYWLKLDPTPQTTVNEAYEKFLNRVRYADAHYSVYRRGVLTDRGLIYVRLGPPDETIRRPVPRDRDDLYEGIDKIMSDYKIIVDSYWISSRSKDVRPAIISPEKQRSIRGLVGDDAGSYEVWNYNFRGDPILPDDKRMTYDQGLRFLFVDKNGYGEYQMVGTSEDMMQGD